MTQLLISIKNVEETKIALDAGVDIIDLKDPNVGALGALNVPISQRIMQFINQYIRLNPTKKCPIISATVGEDHPNLAALLQNIDVRIKMGIDIIKVAPSELFNLTDLQLDNVKLIAVFFADSDFLNQNFDLNLLQKLKKNGFYGAMIDTHQKHQNLMEICTTETLQLFTKMCDQNELTSGLAGSLKPQHIENIKHVNPSYIGFRGGACEDNVRNSGLMAEKINKIKKLLHEHNKFNDSALVRSSIALHS